MRKKRPAYKPHEEWIIQALKRLFKKIEIKADDHHKVGKLPLEIDLVAVVERKKLFSKLPPVFRYFQRHNILEIKSEKARFRVADLQKLQAYGWLYMTKHAVGSPKEVTLTALVHHLTRTVLKALPEYDFQPAGKGIFCRHSHPVSYVISIEEAPDELLPEELQAFSNPKRRMRALLAALQKGEESPIVEAIFNLYESEVDQLMTREALAKKLVKIAGAKKVLAAIDKEEVVKSLDKRYLRKALGKEDVLKAFSREDIVAAALRDKQLRKMFLANLKREQKRPMVIAASRN
jgi:hypothetical protein